MELSGEDLWGAFALDPRDPSNGGLRASDQDREVVRGLLATAYADGRLDREEFDERSDRVAAARLLGDLPAIVEGHVRRLEKKQAKQVKQLEAPSEVELPPDEERDA